MAQQPLQSRIQNDFKVAIICALPLEAGMVQYVLDKEWESNEAGFSKMQGDGNTYTLGMIGKHKAVLLHMPGMGSVDSATVVTALRTSFPGIEIVFVVGICGASPKNNLTQEEIVLGDCIVSTALIQYDFGQRFPGGFSRKTDLENTLGRASPMVRGFLAKLQTPQTLKNLEGRLVEHLRFLQQKEPTASYPGQDRDRLFQPEYSHTHRSSEERCDKCVENIGICTKDCSIIGCQETHLVERVRTDTNPRLHFGRYGSANTVLKSGVDRDQLATADKILAFEMEAAGIWESLPTIIVKSACDYADSHKSKEWQDYAAATAAAGLKAILEKLEISNGFKQVDEYKVQLSLDGVPIAKEFIDRPEEMKRLENVLLPSETIRRKLLVLRGLGGIGKTQLAVNFMRLYQTTFTAVLWLNGASKDSLKRSIAQHASRIESDRISDISRAYASTGKGDIDTIVGEVIDWLKLPGNNRWLIVFDNVDLEFLASDPLSYDIKTYIPSVDHGSILITTRLVQLERLGQSQEVKRVTDETAKAILTSWHDSSCVEHSSKDLLERLDGLPLAIAQAGSYLNTSGVSIETYLRLYDEQNAKVAEALHDSDTLLDDYPERSVWTTWNISYNAVLAKDKYVANLLILWSFLDRNDLWYGLFERARASTEMSNAKALSHSLGSITDQELSFISAMSLLRGYSLIEGTKNSLGYMMHTVVHRWIYFYHGMRHSSLGLLAIRIVGCAVPTQYERNVAHLPRRLLPHAYMCFKKVFGDKKRIPQDQHYSNDTELQVDQADREDYLSTMHMLGLLFESQAKLDEAEKIYTWVLAGKEKVFGAKHLSTLRTVNNLGNVYKTKGRLDEAEKMYQRDLAGCEEALGPNDPSTLKSVGNLANVYGDQGKLDEAEEMYQRALAGYEEVFGPKDPSALLFVNNLGVIYSDKGKHDEAEKMYQRALAGYEEILGPKHPSTLRTVNNLGIVYKDQGKLDKSEEMYQRALAGRKEVSGAKHLATLWTIHNLSNLYSDQGKLDDAEEMYRQILADYEEALGPNHIWTLQAVSDLGRLAYKQCKLDQAEGLLLRALRGYEEVFGFELVKTHVLALNTMRALGDLYSKTRLDESRAMYKQALTGFTKVRGPLADTCVAINQCIDRLGSVRLQDVNLISRESRVISEGGSQSRKRKLKE